MPREIALGDALVPGVLLLLLAMLAMLWLLDWIAGRYDLYRFVWHPSLVRLAVLVIAFAGLGLILY
ncbi:MAG: DUF1656 domain-containing protein [Proteobacteria bacterium]|uniref:DUF1656 domain-containing protein n=1 Tax=Rudaea sp. TaxID=2136325 RepID=UPI0032204B5C|nr:DUF1656 domain-containing protein [Pseudomonadota bacterium]